METDHVPHSYPKGRHEDQPYVGILLHQRSVEVHRLIFLIDDRWWHLDLGPFCNKIGQHLGLDGRLRGIRNALTHHLEFTLRDSSYGIPVLDDLTEREGRHDRYQM